MLDSHAPNGFPGAFALDPQETQTGDDHVLAPGALDGVGRNRGTGVIEALPNDIRPQDRHQDLLRAHKGGNERDLV